MGALAELDRLVQEGYSRAIRALSGGGRRTSLSHFTGQELDITSHLRSTVTVVDVLDAWRNLVKKMKEHEHFIEYTTSLRQAFHDIDSTDPAHYLHLHTLVKLLQHTVEHKNRDNSTECRFVTLLEVMMSYGNKWRPSEQVSRFWVRLMQRIPNDITPVSFRRKAYRVLVSLDWVPSSKGLLAACSFEESKQNLATDKAAPGIRAILSRIRGEPIPRFDCVNQMLDRLKDETDVCVGITSERQGIGKSTLAMLVASHPSIQRVFKVLWLPLHDQGQLDYEWYLRILNDLCDQLQLKQEWPKNVRRFEEEAIRQLREESIMQHAKEIMSQRLLETNENVLLILDDVTDPRQIEWCRFNERQSIIVTTADTELQGVDWYVELDPFSEDEALDLFLREAHFPDSHIAGSTDEIKAIVNNCHCHPLSIRTVARWFHLKRITTGAMIAAEELKEDLAACQPESDTGEDTSTSELEGNHPSAFLYNVLSMMMGPARVKGDGISDLFVIFFAAFVIVFPEKVPFDCALLLWEQLLRKEPRAVAEVGDNVSDSEAKKHAWLISEGLYHMGLITVTEENDGRTMVQVHHNEYAEFARAIAQDIDSEDNFEAIEREWHRAFVNIYLRSRMNSASSTKESGSWKYGVERIPMHMMKASMTEEAEELLTSEHFLASRVSDKGWEDAMKLHVQDCVQLQLLLEEGDDSQSDQENSTSSLFSNVSVIMKKLSSTVASSDTEKINQICFALYRTGFGLIELGYFGQAVAQFEDAMALLPQSTYTRVSLFYGLGCALLASEESEKALQKIDAAIRLMDDTNEEHHLYKEILQLRGDALVANYHYSEASQFFAEVSESMRSDINRNSLDLGSFLIKKGRLHHLLGEFEKARRDIEESIQLKIENGELSRSLAFAYCALGDVYLDLQMKSDAREQFEKAIDVLDDTDCDPNHPDYLLSMGKHLFLLGDRQGCLETIEDALETITISPIVFLEQSPYDLRMVSRIYKAYGDLQSAVEILKDALSLTADKSDSLERASALFDLALILLSNDQMEEGLVFLKDCYEIQSKNTSNHDQVVNTLCKIGSAYLSLESHSESLQAFNEALQLLGENEPKNIQRVCEIFASISDVLVSQGNLEGAITKLSECISKARIHQCEPKYIAQIHEKMGHVFSEMGDLKRAKDAFVEAIPIRKDLFDYEALASDRLCLARIFILRQEYASAEDSLLDSLDDWNAASNAKGSCDTLIELAKLYRLQSKFVKALDILNQAIKMPWEETELKSRVYQAVGHVLLSQGKFLDALKAYQKCQASRLTEFGEHHPKTGDAFRSMGLANYLLNRGDEALILFNDYIRIHDSIEAPGGSNENADYVLALVLVGDVLSSNNEVDMAQNMWNIARDVIDENPSFKDLFPTISYMLNKRQEKHPENGNGSNTLTEFQYRMRSLIENGETELFGQDPSELALLRMHVFQEH